MQLRIKELAETVSKDLFRDFISRILVCKTVTVMYEESFSCDSPFNACINYFDTELILEISASPEIMIACYISDFYTSFNKLMNFREESVITFRNYIFILYPEIEKITGNENLFCVVFNLIEKF